MYIPLPEPPSDPRAQARRERARLQRAALFSALFVALLWWIALFERVGHWRLDWLTLRPGDWAGLIGVFSAPLLHGSLAHLIANSLPLLLLGTLSLATLPRATPRAWLLIWLLSGIGTWLIGRPSQHLGASGLTHGLMFFLVVAGLLRRDRPAIAAGLIAFFLYGGMLLTVLPREAGVSWEYHLSGALAGVLAAVLWFRLDTAPPRKRYSWELEPEVEPNPLEQELELPAPRDVPVLWQRPPEAGSGTVLPFRPRTPNSGNTPPED